MKRWIPFDRMPGQSGWCLRTGALIVAFAVVLAPGFALQLQAGQSATGSTAPVQAPSAAGQPPPASSSSGTLFNAQGDKENPKEDDATHAVLQNQIQDALRRQPTLTSGSVKVTAGDQGIELTGSVVSARERQDAGRIAQSYARGKKVVNHIVVNGRGSAPPIPDSPDKMNANHPANFTGSSRTPPSQR